VSGRREDPPEDVVRGARSLGTLARLEQDCQRCELYLPATQVVPGRGARRARLMLVGEQPGDREDLAGQAFVGPAGRVLAEALDAAGIAEDQVFVTNAVKHFRFEPRGKRRLHKKPSTAHIAACNVWLRRELALVKPRVVVALGATAARALSGRNLAVGANRGRPLPLEGGPPLWVTVHPSALLRMRERDQRDAAFARFVADLRAAATP
jgi:DNA polymerase